MPVFRVCSLCLTQVGGGPGDPAHLATQWTRMANQICCPKNVEIGDQEALISLCCTERQNIMYWKARA